MSESNRATCSGHPSAPAQVCVQDAPAARVPPPAGAPLRLPWWLS